MKAIKGLEDRLYALDQMIASCKKLVNEQKELAQVRCFYFFVLHIFIISLRLILFLRPNNLSGYFFFNISHGFLFPQGFLANQMRAENLKDNSVLPDLCLSHANQLMIMLTNHRKLLDIKQKCTTAKQELANNLQVRLK